MKIQLKNFITIKIVHIKKIQRGISIKKKKNKAIIKIKPLNNLRNWNFNKKLGVIEHDTKHFFSIIGLSVKNAGREVNSWDQPFIKQKNFVGGVIGLVRKNINGLPHYLIEAKFEPGNYNKIQLSPSVQSTYSNLSRIHKGHHNKIMNHYFFDGYTTIKKIWVSEDGGRLYNKRNLHWIINTKKNTVIKSNFKWLTLWEIQEFINNGTYVSPHLRAIISLL